MLVYYLIKSKLLVFFTVPQNLYLSGILLQFSLVMYKYCMYIITVSCQIFFNALNLCGLKVLLSGRQISCSDRCCCVDELVCQSTRQQVNLHLVVWLVALFFSQLHHCTQSNAGAIVWQANFTDAVLCQHNWIIKHCDGNKQQHDAGQRGFCLFGVPPVSSCSWSLLHRPIHSHFWFFFIICHSRR